jgi:hypothetical protein
METIYRHTQVSRVTLAAMGLAFAAAFWWSVRAASPAASITPVLIGLVLLLFSTLTVRVGDGTMDVFFGPGLIRRRIPLHRIREAQVVQSPWYYGWGIRFTPAGWLWNVAGLGGVELLFDDGQRFRVGSDEPDRLAEALRRGMETIER